MHPNEQARSMSSKSSFSIWKTFKHHIPGFLLTILMDVILPLVIYFGLQKYIRPVYALLIASSPPLVMVIFKAIWSRTFDALGFLVFFTFAISAIVAIITRNPIVLLLEKSMVTGIVSMIFTFTLIPFHCCVKHCQIRPLAYYFYQDLVPTTRAELGLPNDVFHQELEQASDRYTQLQESLSMENLTTKQEISAVYEWIYRNCSSFQYSCYLITSIWAIGFLLEFLARLTLIIIHLPINKIVLYGHMILSSITALCILSTIVCIAIERKYTLLFIERWNLQSINEQYRRQQRSLSVGSAVMGQEKDTLNDAIAINV